MRRRAIALSFSLLACSGREGLDDAPSTSDASDEPSPACVDAVLLPDPGSTPPGHALCLADTSAFDAIWELKDPGWCIVAGYDASALPNDRTLTWGRHGGPLEPPGAKNGNSLRRWSAPSGTSGAMTSTSITVDAPPSPWAVDLPFGGWTALLGANLLFVRDGHVDMRVGVHALGAPVGIASASGTRILCQDQVKDSTNSNFQVSVVNALDGCGTGACSSPTRIEIPQPTLNHDPFGMFADPDGNVFAAFNEQRGAMGAYLRIVGYARERIAATACPTMSNGVDAYGNVLPAADGQRIYYGALFYNNGIDTISYGIAESGALVFSSSSAAITRHSGSRWPHHPPPLILHA